MSAPISPRNSSQSTPLQNSEEALPPMPSPTRLNVELECPERPTKKRRTVTLFENDANWGTAVPDRFDRYNEIFRRIRESSSSDEERSVPSR